MGKYSVKGSPAFDARVDADLKRIADVVYGSKFSKHWKALVLTGGYGRGEGSLMTGPDGEEIPCDPYDLVVITNSLDPLLKHALAKLEQTLSSEAGPEVSLQPLLAAALPSAGCSLRNFEIKYSHRVIRGDSTALHAMSAWTPGDIPLSEGTRLLTTRGARLLDIKRGLARTEPLTREERRQFIRHLFEADLAFGDCALLLRGAYDASGAVRQHRLPELDLTGLDDASVLINAYNRAIDFKNRVDFQTLENNNLHLRFAETAKLYEQFFLWYERRRLNRKFQTLEKYAHAFPNLGKEGTPLRNALHNLHAFGTGSLPYCFAHPRLRLYAALPLLLTKHADREEIRWLLRSYEAGFEELCQVFYALEKKFS